MANTKFQPSDLVYALECAAEFLDMEEWPDDNGIQEAANREAARRIRQMARRIAEKS